MFLRRRATQAEYFDLPTRTPAEVTSGFRELARINRLFCFAEPFERLIPRALGKDRCRHLNLLDLGAGDGSLGRTLMEWAETRGWNWTVTSLDMNPLALRLNRPGRSVVASATALPFSDHSFDVVIASQMTHHLADEEAVCRHFRDAWRVTGDLLLINDLHRNILLYGVIGCVLHLMNFSREFREDGKLSIRRGWRLSEWEALAREAGIPHPRISLYYGARILLMAQRTRSQAAAHAAQTRQSERIPPVPSGASAI